MNASESVDGVTFLKHLPARWLLLVLLALPAMAKGQFRYETTNGTIIITGYKPAQPRGATKVMPTAFSVPQRAKREGLRLVGAERTMRIIPLTILVMVFMVVSGLSFFLFETWSGGQETS